MARVLQPVVARPEFAELQTRIPATYSALSVPATNCNLLYRSESAAATALCRIAWGPYIPVSVSRAPGASLEGLPAPRAPARHKQPAAYPRFLPLREPRHWPLSPDTSSVR